MTKNNYRRGVFAIIIDSNKHILLVQKNDYKNNEWTLPGGGREGQESIEQNMFREINEELGLKRDDFELLGISKHKFKYDYPPQVAAKIHQGKYVGQIQDQYFLRFIGNKNDIQLLESELKNQIWVKREELDKYLIFPNQYKKHKEAITELFEKLP